MSFVTFADASANLPNSMQDGITILKCDYTIDGEQAVYDGNLNAFDFKEYYDMLRKGKQIKTSLINTHQFMTRFKEMLEKGKDVIYISMASGISGTYQAAKNAAMELMEEYKDRVIHIVDSKTCGLGTGMQAIRSAQLNADGVDVREAAKILDDEVIHACSYFTVDDLNFLKKTGRVSGSTAAIGTVLSIKPILYGSDEGQILSCQKVRGRKKSIDALVSKYKEKAVDPQNRTVYISHGDCIEDAKVLAEKICEVCRPKQMIIAPHEPFSGAHVGPGMLGLFFYGSER